MTFPFWFRVPDGQKDDNHHAGTFQKLVDVNDVEVDSSKSNNDEDSNPSANVPPGPNLALTRELNEFSSCELQNVHESIHGVQENIEEEPEFVAQNMEAMKQALEKIQEKYAYNLAWSQSPAYVQGSYLQYLRSTNFNPNKAASKLVLFLELKMELFGAHLVGKYITYDDLSSEDQQCVQSGWHQVLPHRDRAGRAVIWANNEIRRKHVSHDSQVRSVYYVLSAVLDDEETQKHGTVAVICGIEDLDFSPATQEMAWKIARIGGSFHSKVGGHHHLCVESKMMLPLVYMAVGAFGKHLRLRTRIHQGTYTENTNELTEFGIPVAHAPVTSSGTEKLKYFRQWLSRRRRLEQMREQDRLEAEAVANATAVIPVSVSSATVVPVSVIPVTGTTLNYLLQGQNNQRVGGIELPNPGDVLLGTGSVIQSYAGNVQFQCLVDKYKEQYNRTPRGDKKQLVLQLYKLLHSKEYSARFLERKSPNDWWQIAPKEVALKKIAHRLRARTPTTPVSAAAASSSSSSFSLRSPCASLNSAMSATGFKRDNNYGDCYNVEGASNILNQSPGSPSDLFICCRYDHGAKRMRLK